MKKFLNFLRVRNPGKGKMTEKMKCCKTRGKTFTAVRRGGKERTAQRPQAVDRPCQGMQSPATSYT